MREGVARHHVAGWIVRVLLFVLLAMGLTGCGGRDIPGLSAPSSPPVKKTPGQASTSGKGGTYKPYTVRGQTYYPLGSAEGYAETGVASWYGPDFHGKRTANGETYDMHQMTAAHRILPMHTRLQITNLDNGRTTEVRVNDRGPFVANRVIDLSYAAADALGVVGPGTARVSLQTIPGQRIEYVGPFYVQYGAFVVEENARKLRSRLLTRGFAGTRIARGELNGTIYWRVQIGAFATLGEAESARIRLAKESPGCFIIAD